MTNCAGNTPRGHQYAFAPYGSAAAAAFTTRLALVSHGMKGVTNTVVDDSMKDSIWEIKGDEVIATEGASGLVVLRPRAANLQAICMCIFGDGAFASNVKLPGNICQYFQWGHSDPVVDKVYRYNNCVTPSASFSASDSDPLLKLEWNIEAQSRTITDGVTANWPSLSASTQQPFVFRQGTLTIGADTFRMKNFKFDINNNLQLQDFFNSLNRVEMPSSGQQFVLTHTSPWDNENDEADWIGSLQEDISATLDFVSGTKQLKFEFPSMTAIVDEPDVSGTTRILNPISWRPKYDSADAIAAPVRITVVAA